LSKPAGARFRGRPSSSVIDNQSNISTRSARVRVRPLTRWLALRARDTWRRWGGGSGACFAGIALLGSRRVQAADALARAARLRPRAKIRGGNGRRLRCTLVAQGKRVGVGTSLRQAGGASGRAARSRPRVKVEGGSGARLAWLTSRVAQGENWGGAAALASLTSLGLR
jgi:hypothetical protein